MKKDLSKLEQQVSESKGIPPAIERYSSNSEDKIIVHAEYSRDSLRREIQEETNIPFLDLEIFNQVWKNVPREKLQKICLEVANELWGQYKYEAFEEYKRLVRKKQREMKPIKGIYEDTE